MVDRRHLHQEQGEVIFKGVNDLELGILDKVSLGSDEAVEEVAASANLALHGQRSDNDP